MDKELNDLLEELALAKIEADRQIQEIKSRIREHLMKN